LPDFLEDDAVVVASGGSRPYRTGPYTTIRDSNSLCWAGGPGLTLVVVIGLFGTVRRSLVKWGGERAAGCVGFRLSTCLIHTIFEGTSEIQQLVIARAISGLRIE
jgi:hypothetical protein